MDTSNWYATYNLTTDKLKLFNGDDRLRDEDYERARSAKFLRWHGSKCFAAKWSPQAEDFILSFGIEIQEDDNPDDVEARVERFEKYAGNAARDAEYAKDRALNATTDRRARLATNSLENNLDKAEYWHNRIAGAIATAAHKDTAPVIVRRIKKLEASIRKQEKEVREFKARVAAGWIYDTWLRNKEDVDNETKISDLSPELLAEYRAYAEGRISRVETFRNRWIEHETRLLEYEKSYLEAIGGDPRESIKNYKAGDEVRYENGQTYKIRSIGSANIQVVDEHAPHPYNKWGETIRVEDFGSPEIIGHEEPAPKKRAAAPEDGIKKGVTVEWTSWEDRYYKRPAHISTVITAGTKTLKVTVPNDDAYKHVREYKKDLRINRKDAKLVEAVADG